MKTLSELRQAVRRLLRETVLTKQTMTGTAAIAVASTTATGTASKFATDLQVGEEVEIGGVIRTIRAIASDTALTGHKPFGVLATGQTVYLVQRQGGWTDEEIEEQLNNAIRWLEGMLLRHAKQALRVAVTATLAGGSSGDVVSIPTGFRRIEFIEYLTATDVWTRLREVRASGLSGATSPPWPWPWLTGAGKPSGIPSAFRYRNATQIELNSYPGALTNGLRFWGASGLSELSADTDTIKLAADASGTVPDGSALEQALVSETAARCLAMTETGRNRAEGMRSLAIDDLKNWIKSHGGRGGRSDAPHTVNIVTGF